MRVHGGIVVEKGPSRSGRDKQGKYDQCTVNKIVKFWNEFWLQIRTQCPTTLKMA